MEESTTLPNDWSSEKVSKVVNQKCSITVQASGGTDGESGVVGYQYSTNGTDWTETIANESSYTFNELTGNTTIYAKTVDNMENLSGEYSKKLS